MRWRGLEPPRGFNPTRPSTLRVYQFRHQRAIASVARVSVGAMKALAEAAVDAALGAGASYADARAVSLRRQYVITKNGQVDDLSDGESEGIGVPVPVDGAR